jgi:hypothetical protein
MDGDEISVPIKWNGEEYCVMIEVNSTLEDLKRRLGGTWLLGVQGRVHCEQHFEAALIASL